MRWIFLLIVLLFWLGVDVYFYEAIKTLYKGKHRRRVAWMYAGICAFLYVIVLISMAFNGKTSALAYKNLFTSVLFIGFTVRLIALPWLLIDDLRRLAIWLYQRTARLVAGNSLSHPSAEKLEVPHPEGMEMRNRGITRSEFLSRAAILTAGIPLVGLTYGTVRGAYAYTLHRVRLNIPQLPAAFDGFTVVQLSDMHLGSFGSRREVERGIHMAMDTGPDCVVFTGDLVNNRSDEALPWMPQLKMIRAPYGVFSVLGNHDYGDYHSWDDARQKVGNMRLMHEIHSDAGWRLLRNQHHFLEKDGEQIAIIGVDNWGSRGRFPKYGDLAAAVDGVPDEMVQILLSHDPSHFEDVVLKAYPHIDVTLSGHTHGMQAGIEIPGVVKWSPSSWMYPYWAGLYTLGRQQLYVNRGFGFLGYPGRLGIWPEITHITLIRG